MLFTLFWSAEGSDVSDGFLLISAQVKRLVWGVVVAAAGVAVGFFGRAGKSVSLMLLS